jgi:hypothetical protein
MKLRNPVVSDVAKSFGRIRRRGHYLAAWDGGAFQRDSYTSRVSNRMGFGNHFQGMVRLGQYVVLSGGDPRGCAAELYVTRMESRKATMPFRSNLWRSTQPPEKDVVAKRICVDTKLWHAGGIDAAGDLVAIPLEGLKNRSRVVFYDFSDPEAPEPIVGASIDRAVGKASAAAVARLADDRFVVAVWGFGTTRWLDFYLSRHADVAKGFDGPARVTLPANFALVEYQAIHFVTQTDGGLFLLGFHNTSNSAPTTSGLDIVHVWEVALPPGAPKDGEWPGLKVELKTWGEFTCKDRQANMDAGAAAWVDPSGELHLYSCYHWRQDGTVRFSEFRALPEANGSTIVEPSQGWIDLFEHTRYAGHCLSLAGRTGNDIREYQHIHVEGSNFNDVVSSVRYQLPPKHRYRLFERADYQGRFVDLVGDGTVVEVPDVGTLSLALPGDRVSSSKWIEPPAV